MTATFEELQALHLFKALSDEQLNKLISTSHSATLNKDQILFSMGDQSEHFHYVASGQVKISRSSPTGTEKILAIIRPGQLFAEAVMFMGTGIYPATATALLESKVVSFRHSTFMGFLANSPELSLAMMCNLSLKLHSQIVEIDNLTLQNATFRTLNFINSLVANDAIDSADVELPAPKHIIASRLSITPETFSRSLTELSTKGIIDPLGKSRAIRIPDLKAFRNHLIA